MTQIDACHQCPLRERETCFCAALTPWQFGSQSQNARQVRLSRRERLGGAGSAADSVLSVTSGVAALTRRLADGRRSILALLFPGELIDLRRGDRPQTCEVEALSKTDMCVFDGETFDSMIDSDRGLRSIASHEMRLRAQQTLSHVLDLSKRRPVERFASFLFEIIDRDVTNDGTSDVVKLPISRADLGNYLGLQPETVSRAIRALEAQQQITLVRRNEIKIRDVTSLRHIACGGGSSKCLPHSDRMPGTDRDRSLGPNS